MRRPIPRGVMLINAVLLVTIPLIIENCWGIISKNVVLLPLAVIALIALCLGTAYIIHNNKCQH